MASVLCSVSELSRSGRLWWLPANGYGNDLDDVAWAPIVELSQAAVPPVLEALRSAPVPAYAARRERPGARLRRDTPRRAAFRLWAGVSAYGRAESVLLAVMPRPAGELGAQGDRAGR